MMIAFDSMLGRGKDIKVELFTGLILIVMAIGAIAVGIFGFALVALYWWIAIPIIFTCFGGGFGFIFGVGLVVIIGIFLASMRR